MCRKAQIQTAYIASVQQMSARKYNQNVSTELKVEAVCIRFSEPAVLMRL
jgi:hypothetical protein